jgi:hypothetical protein
MRLCRGAAISKWVSEMKVADSGEVPGQTKVIRAYLYAGNHVAPAVPFA